MVLLDGKSLSLKIEDELRTEVDELKEVGVNPSLAVILVGDDSASLAYVSMKAKACDRVGIRSLVFHMPKSTSQQELMKKIDELNNDSSVDGILVQLPLPAHLDTQEILEFVSAQKDVDGFNSYNIGRLNSGIDCFVPATPLGVMTLLSHYGIDLKGKNCVVVGASRIVGKPMANLLLNANATISICHIFTDDLRSYTKEADIICVGVGKPNLITCDMVKDGAIVVDIGINKLDDGSIVGDVDFDNVAPKCSYITPVPGGVGPMTIVSLLQNTLKASKERRKK